MRPREARELTPGDMFPDFKGFSPEGKTFLLESGVFVTLAWVCVSLSVKHKRLVC